MDEIDSIKKEAKALTDSGVDIIIAVGHAGFVKDKEIAEKVPQVDVVVGGNNLTKMGINFSTLESGINVPPWKI